MSQELALTALDAVELVDAAIEDLLSFKKVGLRLEGMQPDEQAAKNLIAAFNRQRCEPWLAAFLLGCIGHSAGYQTVKDILLSNARSSSESYAGVAMAKIHGVRAYEDLRQILFGDHSRKVCNGAAYGMVETASTRLLNDLLTAFSEGRLSRRDVSGHAANCNPDDEWLLDLVRSSDPNQHKLASAIIEIMVSPNFTHRRPGKSVAEAINARMCDGSLSMNSHRRATLVAWINAT